MKQIFMERLVFTASAAIIAMAVTIAASGSVRAEEGTAPSPHDGQGQGMAPMQQQMMQGMMQQMQNCMGRMGGIGSAPQDQMRAQMMQRMQSCMTQMQSGKEGAPEDTGSHQKHGSDK